MNSTSMKTKTRYWIGTIVSNGVKEWQLWRFSYPVISPSCCVASFPTKQAAELARELIQQ